MSDIFTVNAEPRDTTGKGASRRLRRANKVPAILYGGNEEPAMLNIAHNEIIQALEHEAFYSHLLTLNVGDKSQQVILKDVQRHPYKPVILHLDFQRVSAKDKLHVHVPIHFINENIAPGVKTGGGQVHHLINELEIVCLPKDLPEFIEIDLKDLQLNDVIHLSDIELPAGVTIVALTQGSDHDHPVVNITRRGGAAEEEEESSSDSDS